MPEAEDDRVPFNFSLVIMSAEESDRLRRLAGAMVCAARKFEKIANEVTSRTNRYNKKVAKPEGVR